MVFGELFKSERSVPVFLGSPEAEAESTIQSRVSILDVYEDYHKLMPALSTEQFIVIGRKGSGKSAFAEFVSAKSKSTPNLFSQFIRASEFQIEKAIQSVAGKESSVDSESFFLWLIYTNILKMFSNNAAIQEDKSYELLRQFLNKNSGYINIKDFEIKGLVEKHGFDVSIEQFKRFFRLKMNRSLEIKSERASFDKLLPHLEEVIVAALSSVAERDNKNSYSIFFDDLDVWFNSSSRESSDSLVSLIRACRRVNNTVFGANEIRAKAIILLRDDIESYISARYADTAKILASYSIKINWYQEDYSGADFEDKLSLKRFINKRIAYAFNKAGKSFDSEDPWSALVDNMSGERSSFKHVVNKTLFRPRDLLLFFKPLENGSYNFPLSRYEINTLSVSYARELAKEVKNELSSFYSGTQVENIFGAITEIARTKTKYEDALKIIESNCKDVVPKDVLEDLFLRSIVGSCDIHGRFSFKCREPMGTANPVKLDKDKFVVVQYGIKDYVLQTH
ncbi:hypothetical protein LOY52_09090 [Pseudomonas sp. B21-051]|uniref:P-loop ATPase, Sll1717 family n=1 Tax=Pseudomonas sp. B21-051 TaxID=2895491 RepID=UPI00215F53A7|nr:hypothetical protein [Pseudomonas sp. B21-051]UVK90207.1 hypothetical protein LOY52_09090 [Pseudomonas sp. B21-051]